MSITIEIDGAGARVVDTTAGPAGAPLDLKTSATVTLWSRKKFSITTGTSDQSIAFDSITAGKALVIKCDGRITVKVNGSATGIPCYPVLVHTDTTTGAITSCTISNASGATVTGEVLIGG